MRRDRAERGAAAVELAIVLPVLVLMLWGIFEFGQGYNTKIQLTAAVRDGVRTAALSTNAATVNADVKTAMTAAAPSLNASALIITVTKCPTTPAATDKATVVATYPYSYDIPFFRSGTWTLTARGVMRCGG